MGSCLEPNPTLSGAQPLAGRASFAFQFSVSPLTWTAVGRQNHTEQAQYLRVYIAQLRRKPETEPARPRHLVTEPGLGYRLLAE